MLRLSLNQFAYSFCLQAKGGNWTSGESRGQQGREGQGGEENSNTGVSGKAAVEMQEPDRGRGREEIRQ